MNKFEKNVQSKNNDVIDSGLAFLVGLLGFTAVYVIAQIFQIVASFN
ncbi:MULTISPECIES: YqzM family protein [Nosocomiicoccus]|uniref:YqzM family protein n=1 Tax=Nosocomiicoccus massiliensis TaxID=1232430 RepID=A0AAF1BNQ2_9STAP|nr:MULTISPECIES: YqzM family protein [Nosocomiicoccus]MDK6862576.1 YqzM family protein [Nosocomiicoccus ampullae]WOS96425.1 YqzM family protein [Nosocomiicoccus massiliensis]